SKTAKPEFVSRTRTEYEDIARRHRNAQAPGRRLTLARARANRLPFNWADYAPPKPTFLGLLDLGPYDLGELARYIDWGPFFQTWELTGPFPQILEDPQQGEAARGLYNDAQAMLKRIVDGNWLAARAVIGFWPANAAGDDIVLFEDETRAKPT